MSIYFIIVVLILLFFIEVFFYLSDGAILSGSIANLYEQYKNDKNIKKIIALKKNANKISGSITIISNISHQIVNRFFMMLVFYYFGNKGEWLGSLFLGLWYAYLELFLKFISVEFAEIIIYKFSFLLLNLYKLMAGITELLEKFVFLQLKIFNIKKKETNDAVDEIRGAIGYNFDKIDSDYANVLKSAADLINWSVLEIMTHRKNLITISVDDSFNNILNIILSTYQEYIPVWENEQDNVIGYINASVFFRSVLIDDYKINNINNKLVKKTIKNYIQKPVFIYKRMTISKFLQMLNNKPNIINNDDHNITLTNNNKPMLEKIFFVVEEDGSFLGIIHRDNVADAIITNTNSADLANIRKYKDGYIIPGGTTLSNINVLLNFDLDGSYITLNNLFLNYYNSLNNKNNYVIINNYKIILLNKTTSNKMVFYIEQLKNNNDL